MNRLTRREWLATSTSILGASILSAEEKPAKIPLGFSLYGMKTLKLEEAISTCAKIGYDGIELALMPGYPSEPKALNAEARKSLRSQLKDSKLTLMGLMVNLAEPAEKAQHILNINQLKAAAELGHAISPDTVPVIETILGGKPTEWETRKKPLVERLLAWAEVAQETKAIIAIKPHVSNSLHTIQDAQWLLEQIKSPHIRLGFDFSHLILQGVKLDEAINNLVPHAAFIHVKDAKGTPEKFEFLLPGEHGIDYTEYAQLLRKKKYNGPVVVEVSGMISNKPGYDPTAAAQKSYTNLAKAFNR